jgi:hypothetical protein
MTTTSPIAWMCRIECSRALERDLPWRETPQLFEYVETEHDAHVRVRLGQSRLQGGKSPSVERVVRSRHGSCAREDCVLSQLLRLARVTGGRSRRTDANGGDYRRLIANGWRQGISPNQRIAHCPHPHSTGARQQDRTGKRQCRTPTTSIRSHPTRVSQVAPTRIKIAPTRVSQIAPTSIEIAPISESSSHRQVVRSHQPA